MSKTVVIHQPDFVPYLGFFHRFIGADLYVALDHVQFVNKGRGWTHRDKIKTPQGAQWLTLSVRKSSLVTPIKDVLLAEGSWREDNLNLLRANYRSSPYFDEIFPSIELLYARPIGRLVDFTMESISLLSNWLDTPVPIVFSSALAPWGRKTEMLVDLLLKVGATRYVSGVGARVYLEPDLFVKAEIELVWQEFTHPVYPQLHGDPLPYLSSIDLLFNCGVVASRAILRDQQYTYRSP